MLGQMRNLGRAGCLAVAVWQGCHKEEAMKRKVRSEIFLRSMPWLNALVLKNSEFSHKTIEDELFNIEPVLAKILLVNTRGEVLGRVRTGYGIRWRGDVVWLPLFVLPSYRETVHDALEHLGTKAAAVRFIVHIHRRDGGEPVKATINHAPKGAS